MGDIERMRQNLLTHSHFILYQNTHFVFQLLINKLLNIMKNILDALFNEVKYGSSVGLKIYEILI